MKPLIDFRKFSYDVRYAIDLKPVLFQPEMLESNFEAYLMFRDTYADEKSYKEIKKHDLRYDFTVIPPAKIGKEFIKTYGHYHPNSYPEIYQVFEGEAMFLMQKRGDRDDIIEELVAVKAEEGDAVIIPPDYGHVTVNSSENQLVISNWVCRSFKSIYEPYTNLRGACYYYTEDGWVRNERYSKIPEIRHATSDANDVLGIEGDMFLLIEEPEKLKFLTNPEKFDELFKRALIFD